MQYAGLFHRLGAYLVDLFVKICLMSGGAYLLEEATSLPPAQSMLLLWATAWAYHALFECSGWQATPGKRLLGIKMVRKDGRRISFLRATARYFMKYIGYFTLGVGFLMMAWTKRKQCLHDKFAGTCAVKTAEERVPVEAV